MNTVATNLLILAQTSQAVQAISRVQSQLNSLAASGRAASAGTNQRFFTDLETRAGTRITRTEQALRRMMTTTLGSRAESNRPWFQSMTSQGSQMQWIGRQLTSNLTLPVLALTGAGINLGLKFQESMTRLDKVYGDGGQSAQVYANEVKALEGAFVALSNKFGVAAEDVASIGADWAAAGSSGKALAEQVGLTLQTMVLGEMDAKEATQALIGIQAQWGAITEDVGDKVDKATGKTNEQAREHLSLTQILRQLNAVENETGTNMADLVTAYTKTSGAARQAGVSTGELAAMVAALVPSAGTASEAGNGLRTIIMRLMKPTNEAAGVLGSMGIQLGSTAWQSKSVTERMVELAKRFQGLTQPQKAVAAGLLSGGWQLNKFSQLMEDVSKETGYFNKSLKLLADTDRVVAISEMELQKVLKSNPQLAKQAGTIIKNSLMKAMLPLIPVFIQVAQWIAKVMDAFASIPASIRTSIVFFLLILSVLGPIVIMMGLVKLSIGQLVPVLGMLARVVLLPIKPFLLLGRAMLWMAFTAALKSMSLLRLFVPVFQFVAAGLMLLGKVFMGLAYFMRAGPLLAIAVVSRAMGAFAAAAVYLWKWMQTTLLAMQVMWNASSTALAGAWAVAMTVISRTWALATLAIHKAAAVAAIVTNMAMWRGLMGGALAGSKALLLTMGRAMLAIVGILASPWVLAIGAVIALIVIFRKQIAAAFKNIIRYFQNLPPGIAAAFAPIGRIFTSAKNVIMRAFNALPAGVKNALLAVVRIVHAAAMKVYELFSYINPFARHSPSLVENVTNGMAEVNKQFANSAKVAQREIGSMHRAIKSLQGVGSGLIAQEDNAKQADTEETITKAGAAKAIPAYRDLQAQLKSSQATLDSMKESVKAQEAKIKSLKETTEAYDKVLKQLNANMENTKSIQDMVGASLDAAKSRYDRFANAQVAGSQAAEDAAFGNTMQQKALQLQIAKLQNEAGGVDKLTDSFSKMQGQIEDLQSKQKELRSAGAGSDILGAYDKMIADIRAQQAGVTSGTGTGPAAQIAQLNTALEKLQKQAEIMDLEKALKFDPLNRKIEQFKNNVQEMPYGEIMSGLDSSKTSVDMLTMSYDMLGQVIKGQEAQIAAVQKQRDAVQDSYDAEQKKLDALNESYSAIEQTINDGKEALDAFTQAAEAAVQRQEEALNKAEKAKKKKKGPKGEELSPGEQAFADAGEGDFATYGGGATIGREGGNGDQSGDIKNITDNLTKDLEEQLGGMNPFAPLMRAWDKTKEWFKNNTGGIGAAVSQGTKGIGDAIGSAFSPDKNSNVQRFIDILSSAWAGLQTFWDIVQKVGETLWKLFAPDILTTGKELWEGIKYAFTELKGPIGDLVKSLGPLAQQILPWLGGAVVAVIGVLEMLWEIVNGAIGPVFNWLVDIIKAAIQIITGIVKILTGAFKIVNGFIQILYGLATMDFGMAGDGLKKMFSGLGDIFKGVIDIVKGIWTAIWSTISNFVQLIWNTVWGFVKGIIDFFTTLWDVLVGHSIVPDMINAIIEWFFKLPGQLLGLVESLITGIIGFFLGLAGRALDAIGDLGGMLVGWITGAFNWLVNEAPKAVLGFLQWFGGLEWKLIDALAGFGKDLLGWITSAFNWLVDHGGEILLNFLSWVTGIPKSVLQKLGNAAGMLYNWGKDMIQGLLDGAGSLLSKIGKFFLDKLPGWIRGPFEKAMDIHSPSKVFAGYGVNLGEGLIQGMASMSPQIEAASTAMADSASMDAAASLDVSAVADTVASARAGADAMNAAQAGANTGGPTALSADAAPDIDLSAADAEIQAFTASATAALTTMTVQVNAALATMAAQVTTTLVGMSGTWTTQFTLMQTNAVTIMTATVTGVNGQLTVLLGNFNTFGSQLNAAWVVIWDAWKLTTTTGVDHTITEWDRLGSSLRSTLDNTIKPVFDDMTLMLDALEDSFTKTVDTVGTTWDGIKGKTADPARFVINDVYNDGIRGAWNQFNKYLDLKELPEFKASFATGGAVKGAGTGTSDSIFARLSHGEHVVTAKEVQAAGGHAAVMRQRQQWLSQTPAFARGGPVDLAAAPWAGGGGESNLKPAAILARRNVHKYFPEIQTIGGYRPYDAYPDHPSGLALDIMVGSAGNPIGDEINNWLHANMLPLALNYTIWKQFYKPAGGGGNLMEDRGSITQNHYDHIHALFNANGVPGIQDGGVGGGTAAVFDYRKMIADGIKSKMDEIRKRDPKIKGDIGAWPMKSVDVAQKKMEDFMLPKADKLGTSGGPSGGSGNIPFSSTAGVEQWRQLATEMLIMQGQSPNYTQRLLMQMNTESSGNPNAINLWDSNAMAGIPSKGLMQVIDPTFQTYRDPRLPNNIWDPAANIAASIRYTMGKYGTLDQWQGVGYDQGGLLQQGHVWNQSGGAEPVLTTSQWQAMYAAAQAANVVTASEFEQAMIDANVATDNTGNAVADAVIKGMDVWTDAWTPAMVDSTEKAAAASEAVVKSTDAAAGTSVLLNKSLGKYTEQLGAFSKLMMAVGNAVQSSIKVSVDSKGNTTTSGGGSTVTKDSKGNPVVTFSAPTFESVAPVLDALAGLLDMIPYAERNWAADNPVPGETEQQKWMRQSQNNLVNFGKGTFNILKDIGGPILKHTALIGTAVEKLITQDGAAWTSAIAMIASGNPAGIAVLVPLILKTLATLLPLILNAILDIVPAIIRAIVRFLTKFMPDSVFAYEDMAAAEAAVKTQQEGGATAQGQGQRYPTDAMSTASKNQNITLYMMGDLVLPNISSGDDAQDFIDQLKTVAAG